MEWQRAQAEEEIRTLRKAQRKLEESQQRFSIFYERAPIGYVTLDARGYIHDANVTIAQWLGFGLDQLHHLSFSFVVFPKDLRIFLDHFTRLQNGDVPEVVTEVRLRAKSGQTLPVELISVPFAVGPNLFLTAIVDLTERKHQEQALAAAKEFSESIVETIREPLAVVDADLKIISVNRAFTQLFQRSSEHIQGRPLDILMNLWWNGNELRNELDKALIRDQPLENLEIKIEPQGMGKRILLLNARRLYRKDATPAYILVAFEDITARKNTEEQLRLLNEDLEKRVEARTQALLKSNEQMESFCYSIAHDLRAPLRAVAGFSGLISENYGPVMDQEGREYLSRIQNGAERMDQLIHDLLEFGRLNTVNLATEDVDLEQIFPRVLVQCEKEIEEKHARIIKKRLQPVHGHPLMLQVVLANLLSNAVKFVPAGVQPEVTVRSEENGSHVRVWVEDNGIGIALQNQQKIFGVFQRLHLSEQYPGTGIGLALVSKGVERIGGRVGVESEPGKGSRFWIDLQKPATAAADAS